MLLGSVVGLAAMRFSCMVQGIPGQECWMVRCFCRYVFRGEGLEPGSAAAGEEVLREEVSPSTQEKKRTKKNAEKGDKGKGSTVGKQADDEELGIDTRLQVHPASTPGFSNKCNVVMLQV